MVTELFLGGSVLKLRLEEQFEVGVFLRRLNRFMTEVELNNERVVAHLPNSGRLQTVLVPKATAFLRKQSRIRRKSSYDLFAVEHAGIPAIVDTRFSTAAARMAVEKGLFEPLKGYSVVKQNAKADRALIDLLLQRSGQQFFLEVKCVTHVVNHVAMFPDAPTLRGRKHLITLTNLAEGGADAGILFSVQRPDAQKIRPFYGMDSEFAELLRQAVDKEVKVFTQTLTFKPPNTCIVKSNSPIFSFN